MGKAIYKKVSGDYIRMQLQKAPGSPSGEAKIIGPDISAIAQPKAIEP